MQNHNGFRLNSLVCLVFALFGCISTVAYFEYKKYEIGEYDKVERVKRDAVISKESDLLATAAEKLNLELKNNSQLASEAAMLMQKSKELKGPEVYKIRVWKDSFQINARFVYSGICYSVIDGCRSDNDIEILGKYPEINKTLPKIPFNSYGSSPMYTLVFREVVEGNKPKIEITVSRI